MKNIDEKILMAEEEIKQLQNHREARRKRKSKYRKSRGRNGNRGIVPCLQGRTYTP